MVTTTITKGTGTAIIMTTIMKSMITAIIMTTIMKGTIIIMITITKDTGTAMITITKAMTTTMIIITTMAKIVPADAMIIMTTATIITIIMRTRCSQAGAERRRINIRKKGFGRSLRNFPKRMTAASSSGQKASYPARTAAGCILIWFRRSMRYAMEKQIIPDVSA